MPDPDPEHRNLVRATERTPATIANLAKRTLSMIQTPQAGAEPARQLIVSADGTADFSTIGEAVTIASNGDVILVRPGEYRERLVVEKSLTIRGDGPREGIRLMSSDPGRSCLRLTGETGTISGLTLEWTEYRKDFTNEADDDFGPAIVSVGAGLWTLENLLARSSRGPVATAVGANLAVLACDFEGDGVIFGTGASGVIERCRINSDDQAIHIEEAGPVTVTATEVTASAGCVVVFDAGLVEVADCALAGADGVIAYDTLDLRVVRNRFTDVGTGISSSRSTGRYEGNTIACGEYGTGIKIEDGSALVASNTIDRPLYSGITASRTAGEIRNNKIRATSPGGGVQVEESPNLEVVANDTTWPDPVSYLVISPFRSGLGILPPQYELGQDLDPNVVDWSRPLPQVSPFAGSTNSDGLVELLIWEPSRADGDTLWPTRPVAWAVGLHAPGTEVTVLFETNAAEQTSGRIYEGTRPGAQIDFYPLHHPSTSIDFSVFRSR